MNYLSQHDRILKTSYVKHMPGHKNSQGESAPWVVCSHEGGKILSSHKSRAAARKHLQDMHIHKHYSKGGINMDESFTQLVSLANLLDSKGFHDEANILDRVIKSAGTTIDEENVDESNEFWDTFISDYGRESED